MENETIVGVSVLAVSIGADVKIAVGNREGCRFFMWLRHCPKEISNQKGAKNE